MSSNNVNGRTYWKISAPTYLHTLIVELRPIPEYIENMKEIIQMNNGDCSLSDIHTRILFGKRFGENDLIEFVFITENASTLMDVYRNVMIFPRVSFNRLSRAIIDPATPLGQNIQENCPFAIVSEEVEEIYPEDIVMHVPGR